MKEYTDKFGNVFEVTTKEQTEQVVTRAKNCLKELLEVLEKHQCKIESRTCGEERVLVPFNPKGNSYVQEEDVGKFGSTYTVEIDLDGPTFLDAINEAYARSKEKAARG